MALAGDARIVHRRLFQHLTPLSCDYFAGHYRGEDFRCLRECPAVITSDPRVGAPFAMVNGLMADLIARMSVALDKIDRLTDPSERLLGAVRLASYFLEYFLRVHPYANGNGHIARFGVWAILGRYGHWPEQWPVDPRPPDPPYVELIVRYRNGEQAPLEVFLLSMLIGVS
jgi:fido (protein-threonine AMPylation protein)